ncbi:MAG: hypothetical protein M3364_01195 [Actinomycetota bacterium]|nr:hypothetical protein [Actinomycetota bacterium]
MDTKSTGIPPLAGLCTYEEASRPGLSVEENVALLRRYNYVERRLVEISAAHLARTPEWEVKCALGLHLWLDAEHASALRTRVGEMREPAPSLDDVPDEALHALLEEVLRAETTAELLTGVYCVIRPELALALRSHLGRTNPLIDHPTCRTLKLALQEELDMISWGNAALEALANDDFAATSEWETHLGELLGRTGGIAGDRPAGSGSPSQSRWDGGEYEMDAVPRRDARFVDPFNSSARVNDYYVDESRPSDERVYALLYKRLKEMDVPELMAPIIFKTRGKPWGYYVDLARQLWDEARHAMMGEVGLESLDVPFHRYPVDIASSFTLNTELTPLESHAILWWIEQGLMPRKTGKPLEWQIARDHGDDLYTAFQDYDWADEVLHARIGREWLIPDFGGRRELAAAAQEAWPRWQRAKDEVSSRSEQEPWWPDFLEHARGGAVSE